MAKFHVVAVSAYTEKGSENCRQRRLASSCFFWSSNSSMAGKVLSVLERHQDRHSIRWWHLACTWAVAHILSSAAFKYHCFLCCTCTCSCLMYLMERLDTFMSTALPSSFVSATCSFFIYVPGWLKQLLHRGGGCPVEVLLYRIRCPWVWQSLYDPRRVLFETQSCT